MKAGVTVGEGSGVAPDRSPFACLAEREREPGPFPVATLHRDGKANMQGSLSLALR